MVFARLMPMAATLLFLAATCPAVGATSVVDAPANYGEKREERTSRFLLRIADDLAFDHKIMLAETALLEGELERILPLEPPERKDFYRTISNRYRYYGDNILEAQSAIADAATEKRQAGSETAHALQRLEDRNEALVLVLREVERKAEKDADRVARIIERRNLLLDILHDLQERRERLEARRHDREERHDDEKERVRLKKEIELRQLDLLSLGTADEDLLRHYLVAAERIRGETDWLEAKREEYEAIRDAIQENLTAPGQNVQKLRKMAAWYDRGTVRLLRKIETIEKKSADISPSGTLRQLDRSREMQEAFSSLRERYLEQAERYRLRSSDYTVEAELAEQQQGEPAK